MRVLDLQMSQLPKEFFDVLPTHCSGDEDLGHKGCGTELQITESLSEIWCPNPKCLEKAVNRLRNMLNLLGVKNMGESRCRKYLEYWGTTNPYTIFVYEPKDGPLFEGASDNFSLELYKAISNKRTMSLSEYVSIGGLRGITSSANLLFAKYHCLDSFYADLESQGTELILELLGIEKSGSRLSVRALNVYESLIYFKDELYSAINYVEIKGKSNKPTLRISITGSLASGTKSDFISKLRVAYGAKVNIELDTSFTEQTMYLISDTGMCTSKAKKAIARNIKALNTKLKSEDVRGTVLEGVTITTANYIEHYKNPIFQGVPLVRVTTSEKFLQQIASNYS